MRDRLTGGGVEHATIELRDARVEGCATVQYVVDAGGRVERDGVRVVDASHREFADAVSDALRRVRFRPAAMDGRPLRQLVRERLTFTFVPRTPTIRVVPEPATRLATAGPQPG